MTEEIPADSLTARTAVDPDLEAAAPVVFVIPSRRASATVATPADSPTRKETLPAASPVDTIAPPRAPASPSNAVNVTAVLHASSPMRKAEPVPPPVPSPTSEEEAAAVDVPSPLACATLSSVANAIVATPANFPTLKAVPLACVALMVYAMLSRRVNVTAETPAASLTSPARSLLAHTPLALELAVRVLTSSEVNAPVATHVASRTLLTTPKVSKLLLPSRGLDLVPVVLLLAESCQRLC